MRERSVLDLRDKEEAIVKRFKDSNIACKLLTVGIIPESRISIMRRAPFGGAVCLRLGQTYIAIRNREAKSIIVE